MDFRVEITDLASEDIDEAVAFIAQNNLAAAAKWKEEVQKLILSLSKMPMRFAVIPEAEELPMPYRSALHYSHRIVYRIDDTKRIVYIVRVYHGARHPLKKEDFESPNKPRLS